KPRARPGSSPTAVGTVFADPTTNSGAGRPDPKQGTFVAVPITTPAPGPWESSRSIGGTDYGLRASQVFGSRSLATLQASRHQERYDLVPTGDGLRVRVEDFTCAGGTSDEPCDVPGAPNFVTGGLGLIYGPNNHGSSRRDQVRGDATFYAGSHDIKLGGDYQDGRTDAVTLFSGGQRVRCYNQYGQTYYRHDFFAVSNTDFSPVDNNSHWKVQDIGAFLQDSWRPAPGLTINAGLRMDREHVFDDLDEAVIRTTTWQPRLGVSWDPNRDGRTKLYAFAGRFSYGLPTDLAIRSYGRNNFYTVTYNFDPVGVAQDPNVPHHEMAGISEGDYRTPVDPGLKGISQDELTIGVEKLLGTSFTLGLKATYRRLANTIEDRCDLDWNRPETNYSGCGITNPG